MRNYVFGLASRQIQRPEIPVFHRDLFRGRWRGIEDRGKLIGVLERDLHLCSVLRLLGGEWDAKARCSHTKESAGEIVDDLGVENARDAALGVILFRSARLGNSTEFPYDRSWARSLASGIAALRLAKLEGFDRPVQSFLSGFLSGYGQAMFAKHDSAGYDELLRDSDSEKPLEMRELERFGVDRDTVAWATLRDAGISREVYAPMLEASREVRLMGRAGVHVDKAARERSAPNLLLGQIVAADGLARRSPWGGFVELRRSLELEFDALNSMSDAIVNDWWVWGELLCIPTQTLPGFSELSDWNERGVEPIRFNATGGKPLVPRTCGDGLDILLVEDSKIVRKTIQRMLVQEGHRVRMAEDGVQALELFRQDPAEVVLSDWEMPNMDGLELCTNLRRTEVGNRAFFVLFTGEDEEDKIIQAYDAGINEFVVKGSSRAVLLARIVAARSFLKHWEMIDEDRRIIRTHCEHSRVLAAKMKTDSLTDTLTELPNRRFAMDRLAEEWTRCNRTGHPMSVIMLDIDFFKAVNDDHGHDVGDFVLKETSRVLREAVRTDEAVCRIGGEEFLIICTEADLDEAYHCAERMRKAIEGNHISWGSFDGNVTVSLGAAVRCSAMAEIGDLLKLADEGVYKAKETGRNKVVKQSPPPHEDRRAG